MPVKCEEMFSEDFLGTDTSLYMMDLEEEDWRMTFLDQTPLDLLNQNFDPAESTTCDFNDLLMPTEKPQIRHHDCMWSGTCRDKSHPLKKKGQTNACVGSSCNSTQADKAKPEPLPKITIAKNLLQPFKPENRQNIKVEAGRSLLISRNHQQTVISNQMNSHNELSYPLGPLRPDTPLSLSSDEAPEFKHSIDFGKMRVDSGPNSAQYISMLREHLEDPSNEPYYGKKCNAPGDLNDILTDITFLSDYEDMGDDCSTIDIDEDDISDDGEQDNDKNSRISSKFQNAAMSTVPVKNKQQVSQQYSTEYMGDHSYTRPKNRYDLVGLGVQTPSDSEEEIDGDSVGDKTLPTNPSARDRRALQTTVAHKMARISKTAYNQQRRRVSDDDGTCSSLSTASSQSNTPVKVGAMYASNQNKSESRKRQSHPKDTNNNDHSSSKKYSKNKKQRLAHQTKQQALQKAAAAATEDLEEAETVEKRNLHNNMERQRRIGLKNLFEELKRQIPSLKDKERAPKVNILREAAAYCHKLKRDDDLHNELLKKQNRLLARVRSLRNGHQQRKF